MTAHTYTPEFAEVRRGLLDSLKVLGAEKIDFFYLHGPDQQTPFEVTFKGMSEVSIRNNWIRPTVYQGIHNALHRAVEPELIKCLRKYDMCLYLFQPLAGSFLAGRYRRDMSEDDYVPGSRFDPRE
ncbi:hypothetical protein QQZ08_008754 [Neonectria magnoliae]|uniref:NADP-dependent oxidoreductase domain-containing protein n=1 Tax=Neonectria magnoliae TaxID=2732573 RepID=A0ABR1HSE9_9HYPO